MSKTLQELQQELDAKIPRSAISTREGGGGKQLSYLAGHYVIDRLNKVFGPLNWASQTTELRNTFEGEIEGKYGKSFYVSYIAKVRLVVTGPDGKATEHSLHGFGDGSDKSNPGKAHELAVKEAETDALKRAAKNLGMSMGLALYDKEQVNVEEHTEAKEAAPKSTGENGGKANQSSSKAGNKNSNKTSDDEKSKVLTIIAATSKVAVQRGKATIDGLKAEMKKRYNTDSKETLTIEQAKEFLEHLNTINN